MDLPDRYTLPFTMTEEITNLVIEIAELIGQNIRQRAFR